MRYFKSFLGAAVLAGAVSLSAAHHETSFEGVWNAFGTLSNGGSSESTLTIKKKGDKITAVIVDENRNSTEIDRVTAKGKTLRVEVDIEQDGQSGVIGAEGTLNAEGLLKGKWFVNGSDGNEFLSESWEATRSLAPDLKGSWDVVAKTDQGDNEHQVVFEGAESDFSGYAESDAGTAGLTKVEVARNTVEFELPFGEGSIAVEARYQALNRLVGEWTYRDAAEQDVASGEWLASKKVPASPVVGEWAMELDINGQIRESTLTISETGDGLKGVYNSPRVGRTECDSVTFEDGTLVVTVTREIQGNDVELVFTGQWDDGKLSGSLVPKGYEDQFQAKWTGTRK